MTLRTQRGWRRFHPKSQSPETLMLMLRILVILTTLVIIAAFSLARL